MPKNLWKVFRVKSWKPEDLERELNRIESEGWDIFAVHPPDGGEGYNIITRRFYFDEHERKE